MPSARFMPGKSSPTFSKIDPPKTAGRCAARVRRRPLGCSSQNTLYLGGGNRVLSRQEGSHRGSERRWHSCRGRRDRLRRQQVEPRSLPQVHRQDDRVSRPGSSPSSRRSFPADARDPQGLHQTIWSAQYDGDFEFHADKPLTLASYRATTQASVARSFVEPVAVGDVLPAMPLFLWADRYINVDLERTHQSAWEVNPAPLKPKVESGAQV